MRLGQLACEAGPLTALLLGVGLISCAGQALQQRLAPYPGQGQTPDQMQRDSADCDAWARMSAGSGTDSTLAGGVGGAAVGSALGAGLGAIAGSFFGQAGTGAAMGAALGGLNGGAQGAGASAAAWDSRLTVA